ncbi:MAG: OmpH family outer membrane protein [Bacteroidales bacterium]
MRLINCTKTYQAEALLMPEDIKRKREEEIVAKEKEVKDLQVQRFGKDGDLFLKREELVKPIQEKIFNSIEEIATEKNYAFVFDKAGSLTILYVNTKYDISDDVLDDVGAELEHC